MIELLSFLAHAYPGWTLLFLFLLAGGAISAVPATAAALRGTPQRPPSKDDDE